MLLQRLGDRAEDHAGLGQFFLEGRANRDGVEHRVHGDLAPFDASGPGAFDARQDHLLLQRDAELLIGAQQFGVDLVQALGLLVAKLLGWA